MLGVNTEMTEHNIKLNAAEKSLVKEYLEDGIESCDHDIIHCNQQKRIKEEKGQMESVKDYERSIAQTKQLKSVLTRLVEKFK